MTSESFHFYLLDQDATPSADKAPTKEHMFYNFKPELEYYLLAVLDMQLLY
jgi:hypothetical protein